MVGTIGNYETRRPIIGIDPGLNGAIACLYKDRIMGIWDMPTMGERKSRIVCSVELSKIIELITNNPEYAERPLCICEIVSSRPGQGSISGFSFGRALGAVEGVIGVLKIPLIRVSPQLWKRKGGLIGKEKDFSRRKAIELFPEMSESLKRKKDNDRAEAMLIAYYGSQLKVYNV